MEIMENEGPQSAQPVFARDENVHPEFFLSKDQSSRDKKMNR